MEVDRHSFPLKHSAHERLFLHVVDESAHRSINKNEALLASSLSLNESIKMSDSTLMFSKKPVEKDTFFNTESMIKKISEKEDILLMGTEDNNLISSQR